MSKYTTEVRFICEVNSGLNESVGYSKIEDVITGAIPKIFDFDFPIFDESYRGVLERKILKHFYTREICEETVGLWKLRLNTRLNEIMPYYNKLYKSELLDFNPLYTDNLTRTRTTKLNSKRETGNNGEVDTTNNSNSEGSETGTTNNNGSDLYSDTPQGSLNGVESGTYLTNARKTIDTSTSSSCTSNNSSASGKVVSSENGSDDFNSTEDYLESVSGYAGVNASDLLKKYRETFINIDMMIIDNLEDLFFQLW